MVFYFLCIKIFSEEMLSNINEGIRQILSLEEIHNRRNSSKTIWNPNFKMGFPSRIEEVKGWQSGSARNVVMKPGTCVADQGTVLAAAPQKQSLLKNNK
jgi:hypothetical protein